MTMNIKFDNRRKYHRVNFDGKADLDFITASHNYCQVKNLSSTGMFLLGNFQQQNLKYCRIVLFHKEKSRNNCLRASGEFVWGNAEGVGLRFTSMTFENYMLLHTTLINKTEQPAIILREFPKDCPFEISS